MPHHVVQRGHRRGQVFLSDHDRSAYLQTLCEFRVVFAVRVYAYCLMSNHVHLIVDPGANPRSLSLLMKRLAGRHARRLNRKYQWTGSIWESRFHCSPIDTQRYLLNCGRYVDQNPVRARMVKVPGEFPWSSFRARAGLIDCDWLDEDPVLAALSPSVAERGRLYRELASAQVATSELALIRTALRRNQLTGDQDFVDEVHRKFGIGVPFRGPGRPRKLEDPE